MDLTFFKSIARDIFIFTIPFIIARTILYPFVNINAKMQRQYLKLEEEQVENGKYQKYQSFSFSEKKKFVMEMIRNDGIKSLYEKAENYIFPFILVRIAEGLIFFPFMRICLEILKMNDPLFLLTGVISFFVNMTGSFCLKFFTDVIRERKDLKSILKYASPSNEEFWKQYEIELGHYHFFHLLQCYFQLTSFWHFKPGYLLQMVLFSCSRVLAASICFPITLLVKWAKDNDYDYAKVFNLIIKRDGKFGLYAGLRDLIINETIYSVTMVSGNNILARVI